MIKNIIVIIWFTLILMLSVMLSCEMGGVGLTVPSMNQPDTPNAIQTVIDDMRKPHQGIPHGVPSTFDWHSKPVIHYATPLPGYTAFTAWGQVFEEERGSNAPNTRVHIRNVKAYYLSLASGEWIALQNLNPIIDGKWFPEDYNDEEEPIEADDQSESEGISATAGNGSCFHYWIKDRAAINPDDIGGIFTTCEARLIVADLNAQDDRLNARYVLSMGADYYQNVRDLTEQDGENITIGTGRFKYVFTGWQSYNFTTLSDNQILVNPPPID